jgi:predicted secreted hydrolase
VARAATRGVGHAASVLGVVVSCVLLDVLFTAHAAPMVFPTPWVFPTSMWVASSTPLSVTYPDVVPGRAISFPRDEGSHPEFRIEWWYITGWLKGQAGDPLGFQITFFRTRPGLDESNPSRFAAKQLLFAHVAVSDPNRGELLRAERSARAGFSLAEASEEGLDVRLDDWSLRKEGAVYRARIASDEFAMDFVFEPTQAPLLQGIDGFSQKGPAPRSASYYYSLPQLRTSGTLSIGDDKQTVSGEAWFDHEWSSTIMDEQASGWDWAGINFTDGTAVMAFQMRNREQQEHWAAATWRKPEELPQTFAPAQIEWTPLRRWRSPRTSIEYPIEWRVRIGSRLLTLKPLMDDQENDARNSTGTLYWEGAVRAFDERGAEVGKGYLELTGYGSGGDEVMR